MPAYRIAIEEDVAESHHARLTEGGDLVPAGDVIALVHGDGAEPASNEFLQRLKDAATMIGQHTDAVRAVVKQNADALRQAAQDLREADDASASVLSSVTAVIDNTAADTTHQDVQASQTFLSAQADAQPAAAESQQPSPTSVSDGGAGRKASGGDAL
ncbi:MAG: hypothetical protein J0I43_09635 [Microbacterium sp.]|uniref:hypothetical protein n=1 Tax=Microbacterium sp. TaxID=51671 RepID=UPI001ACEE6C9|nr:hypothetical protein [Microbacterium sp.]MBN9177612.1 hypothetical protein [Microbacterium sp.]